MSDDTEGAGEGVYFAFRGRDLLVLPGEAGHAVPGHEHWSALELAALRVNDVGTVGGLPAFAVELPEDARPPAGAEFLNLRRLYGSLTDQVYRMAGRAVQVVEWDRSHQFCGRCGTPTARMEAEMAKRCPACGQTDYPRISPAVIMRVEREGRILLARGPNGRPGAYSVLAGFVEPGESLEQAVAREVMEEVGVEVGDVAYFGSQPWPFPNSLMVGFTARWAGGDLLRLQQGEIEDARWFTVGEMPLVSPPLSIARALIDDWVRRQGGDPAALKSWTP
jgi:NAD+ diphosphatase